MKETSGSAVITLFSHTAGGRFTTTPKSNLDKLLPTLNKGGKTQWGFGQFDDYRCLGVICCVKLGFKWLFLITGIRPSGLFLAYFLVTVLSAASVDVTGACEPQT